MILTRSQLHPCWIGQTVIVAIFCVWSRLQPALILAILLSLGLGAASHWILKPPMYALRGGYFILATVPIGIACTAVGLGIRWASPAYKQPDQAITGSSGVIMMVLAVMAVFAQAGLLYLFGWEWYQNSLVKKADPKLWSLIVFGSMWLLVVASSTVLPLLMAKRRLERWDL